MTEFSKVDITRFKRNCVDALAWQLERNQRKTIKITRRRTMTKLLCEHSRNVCTGRIMRAHNRFVHLSGGVFA